MIGANDNEDSTSTAGGQALERSFRKRGKAKGMNGRPGAYATAEVPVAIPRHSGRSVSSHYSSHTASSTASGFATPITTAQLVDPSKEEKEILRLRQELEEMKQQPLVHAEPMIRRQSSFASISSANSGTKRRVGRKRQSKTRSQLSEELSIFDPSLEETSVKTEAEKFLQIASLALHGRDHEIEILQQCLHKTDHKQLVMVSGHSGCGKTALASSLKPVIEEQNGLYVSGKFDLYLRDLPYFGIVAFCQEICKAILGLRTSKSRKRSFQGIRDQLNSALSKQQIQTLSRVIPEIQDIMDSFEDGPTHEYPGMSPTDQGQECKSRFHFAFRIFFRVVNQYFAPLVVTLDDLQWADAASLELMQCILTDTENPHFLMIGLYRSDEVDMENPQSNSNPLTTMLYELEEREDCNLDITEMEVGNLDKDCVQSVVMDLLAIGTVSPAVVDLAAICHQRTLGNVFFLISFMSMLVDEELLQYNYKTSKWTWDIEEIKSETDASSNLVDLVKQKMKKLAPEMGKLLSVAACLGSSFEVPKLEKIWQRLDPSGDQQLQEMNIQETLETITKEGILESLGFARYGWIHDKVQEAASSLVPVEEASSFKFQVGKTLQEEMESHEVQEHLFLIVNLLNETTKDQLDEAQQFHLARLNLQATEKAISCSAFSSAANYASKGINYLPIHAWTTEYQLTMDLHSFAVEANELVGNFDDMKTYSDAVLAQRHIPLRDKVRVYSAMASQLCNSGENEQAVELMLDVLASLGCKFPRSFLSRQLAIVAGLGMLKLGVKKRTTKEAMLLPILEDPQKIELLKLLDKLGTCSYLCGQEDIFSLVIIKITGMTLKHGVCEISSPAFAGVGLVLGGVLGDLHSGHIFANYALELEKKLKCGISLSRTKFVAGFFVLPWQQPWQESCSVLLESYSQGMSSGDTESATYAMMSYMILSTMQGKPLKQIEADCCTYSKQMKELKREQAYDYTRVVWQSVLNLMGATSNRDPTTLEGEVIADMKSFVDIYSHNQLMMACMRSYQLRLFVVYGEYVRGAYLFRDHGYDWPKAGPGDPLFMDMVFAGGIASYASARITKELKFKWHARKARKTIREWVHKNNPNLYHYEALLDAEHAALKKRNRKAERYYQSAIAMATRAGCLQDAALANERYIDFLLSVSNNRESASVHVKEAIKLYQDWGALKKVELLLEKYSNLV